MKMADWAQRLEAFLEFNEYDVRTNTGTVSAEVAKQLAETQWAAYRVKQDETFESDFEREVKRIGERRNE